MQKIQIKNFFAIEEAEFNLDKVLLLIGEQASGKSTVAKIIYFFRTLGNQFITVGLQELTDERIVFSPDEFQKNFFKLIRHKFADFFGSTTYLAGFDITYYYTEHKSLRIYHNRTTKSLEIEFDTKFYYSLFQDKLPLLLQVIQQQLAENTIYDGNIFTTYINSIYKLAAECGLLEERRILFVPAERSVAVSYPDSFKLNFFGDIRTKIQVLEDGNFTMHSPINLYLLRDFVLYSEKIKEKFKNSDFNSLIKSHQNGNSVEAQGLMRLAADKIAIILKGQYSQDQDSEKIYYRANKFSELKDLSSGQQEALRLVQDIFLTLLDHQSVFRIIEEPEAHLYPMAQKHLIELLVIMLNNTDSQVIITTHSPYILSVFNNLLYAARVADINPLAHAEIAQTIPEVAWLAPETFYGYALKDGMSQSIVDNETGLIDQNFLDEISEQLGDEFNTLYSLHAEAVR